MNQNYSELFKSIIAPHLHKIVDIVTHIDTQTKFIGTGKTEFDSMLGAEYSWSLFFDFSKTDSDYVARLSFWLSGLREKFNSDLTRKECIKLLNDVFNASTYAYFEFGTLQSIYREIENFCVKVDKWMDEGILITRLEKFRLIGKPVSVIIDFMDTVNKKYSEIKITIDVKKNLNSENQIKHEFREISRHIIFVCLNYAEKHINEYPHLSTCVDGFVSDLESLGYMNLLTTELKNKQESCNIQHQKYVAKEKQLEKDEERRQKLEEQKQKEEDRKERERNLDEIKEHEKLIEEKLAKKRKQKEDEERARQKEDEERAKTKESTIPTKSSHKKQRTHTSLKIGLIITGIILFILVCIFLFLSIQPGKTITKNETSTISKTDSVKMPYSISIANYSSITDNSYTGNVSLLGYLKEEHIPLSSKSSKIVKSISDDEGNKIRVSLGLSASNKYDKLFLKNTTTIQTYRVTGVLRGTYDGLVLDVNEIISEDKPGYMIDQVKQVNVINTKNETTSISLNVSYGLNKIKQVFSCNESERRYNLQCIPVIKCSDGTLDPECSMNKPLQCVNYTLINNPNKCGCPEDYRIVGNQCVKIQKCNDGTLYQECSSKRPLYCDSGNLVEKASICGCPMLSHFEAVGDKCTDLRSPDTTLIEKRVHELINEQRKSNGLSTLNWNDKIASAARLHSQDMVDRNYFEHDSPNGEDFSDRYSKVGYSCAIHLGNYIYGGAENIHQGWTYGAINYINGIESSREWLGVEGIAQNAVNGWMNSPGHRQNILTSYWKNEGIGVAIGSDGAVLVTQNFC